MGQRYLVEQPDRAVGLMELRVKRSVEGIDSHRHPVKPGAMPSWSGRSDCVFKDVQSMQGGLTFCADVSRKRVDRAFRSRHLSPG
jgi:hypothetical protein